MTTSRRLATFYTGLKAAGKINEKNSSFYGKYGNIDCKSYLYTFIINLTGFAGSPLAAG